jgi:hypothetical protein
MYADVDSAQFGSTGDFRHVLNLKLNTIQLKLLSLTKLAIEWPIELS